MKSRGLFVVPFLVVVIALPATVAVAQPQTGNPSSEQIILERRLPKGPFHFLTLDLYSFRKDRVPRGLVSELLLADPDGRRTGVDPITKLKYKEIPRSSYGEGDGDAPMKELEIYGPPDGSYLLQVIGTATGPYSLYVHPLDENGDSPPNQPFFDNIPTLAGVIHAYRLEYTRTPGVPMKVTGGFEGGEETQSEIDKLLTYAYPTAPQTEFRAKQTSFPLVILYGPTILPKTFKATLNGTDISRRFKPVPGGYQVVPLRFVRGSHTLILSVQGKTTAGQVATDKDELLFNIP